MTSTTFKNIVHTRRDPAEVLAITNKRLFERMPGDAFVSMFFAIYDANSKVLRYTQAGHPPAYVLRKKDQSIQALTTGNPIVGACAPDEITFTTEKSILNKGDKLVMYTDAITDILHKTDDATDLDRLQDFLHMHSNLDIVSLFNDLYAYGLKFSNRKYYPDDFTMVGLEVL
jgi:serine phosphatase RsbU (regulator of sigma subunit)